MKSKHGQPLCCLFAIRHHPQHRHRTLFYRNDRHGSPHILHGRHGQGTPQRSYFPLFWTIPLPPLVLLSGFSFKSIKNGSAMDSEEPRELREEKED